MNFNPFRGWRSKLSWVLGWIAPEESSLDAVFGSYSDWHKFRPKAVLPATGIRPEKP
jgi:hypothetical protein